MNRDHVPDIPQRMNVSAYPSLITLGEDEVKIHRFSGYMEPEPFIDQLKDALRRWDLYRNGEEWDEPTPRPERIVDRAAVTLMKAPSEDIPDGIVFLNEDLWVAQGERLYRLEPVSGEVRDDYPLPPSVRDLSTDGEHLFGMSYGWTAGRPLYVIDPGDGTVQREIVTRANLENVSMGAAGMAWHDGLLWVLSGMEGKLSGVDPETGEIVREVQSRARWLTALDFDGEVFVAGSRENLYRIDPATGALMDSVGVNYPLRALTWHDGEVWLMEQPVFGFDKKNQQVRIWPRRTVIHRLYDPFGPGSAP